MVRVPPHLAQPGQQDALSVRGPLTFVYSEDELLEQISRAAADTDEVQGDQVTFRAAFVPFTIILAEAFRFTAPVVLPAEAVGLTIRAASPGIRFDVKDGIEAVFKLEGLLQRIEDIFIFTEGLRNADAFVVNENGADNCVVRGNNVYAAKRLVYATGAGIEQWRILDNVCSLTSGTESNANVDLADATDCWIQRNHLGADTDAITIRAGSGNDVTHNKCGGGNVTTSATSGGNVVALNRDTGTVSTHASDYAAGNL